MHMSMNYVEMCRFGFVITLTLHDGEYIVSSGRRLGTDGRPSEQRDVVLCGHNPDKAKTELARELNRLHKRPTGLGDAATMMQFLAEFA